MTFDRQDTFTLKAERGKQWFIFQLTPAGELL
jgi:hypothetical protein